MRDLASNELTTAEVALADPARCTAHFSRRALGGVPSRRRLPARPRAAAPLAAVPAGPRLQRDARVDSGRPARHRHWPGVARDSCACSGRSTRCCCSRSGAPRCFAFGWRLAAVAAVYFGTNYALALRLDRRLDPAPGLARGDRARHRAAPPRAPGRRRRAARLGDAAAHLPGCLLAGVALGAALAHGCASAASRLRRAEWRFAAGAASGARARRSPPRARASADPRAGASSPSAAACSSRRRSPTTSAS